MYINVPVSYILAITGIMTAKPKELLHINWNLLFGILLKSILKRI